MDSALLVVSTLMRDGPQEQTRYNSTDVSVVNKCPVSRYVASLQQRKRLLYRMIPDSRRVV
jgi:hypothetical protein